MSFVHQFVPGDGAEPRTILALHGTGGDETSLVSLAQALLPGAPVLSPRGNVSENGMPRFFRRFSEGVFDLDNLREEANALADFVVASASEYSFDPSQVVAMGYSNGANIAWTTMLLRPAALSELVLFRPMVTLREFERADLSGKRIFVSSGERDSMVPTQSVESLVEQMQFLGADVTVNWYQGGWE